MTLGLASARHGGCEMAKEALLGVLRGKGRRAYEAAQKLLLEVHSLENALKLRFGMVF